MRHLLSVLFLIFLFLPACSSSNEEQLPAPPTGDSVEIIIPSSDSTALSVAEAQRQYELLGEQSVSVEAYIVGCVASSRISGAQFTAPFSSASNLLLADAPNETQTSRCFPVSLPSGSAIREALNLVSHPELLQHRLHVEGILQVYFEQVGFRKPTDYKLLMEQPTWEDISIPISVDSQLIEGGRLPK